MEGLVAAQNAFEKFFENLGAEPGQFDIRFTAWGLDHNLTVRLFRVELEKELKDDK